MEGPLRIRQYVYFGLKSEAMSATAMASEIGLEPDQVLIRGSRKEDPPVPRAHAWKLVCEDRGLTVDDQIDDVVRRLLPAKDRILELVRREHGPVPVLQVVRYFGDSEGEEDDNPDDERVFEGRRVILTKLSGQHHLLGWHLRRDVMELVMELGAEIDFDEYG